MRHFIDLADWSSAEIRAMLDLALRLKTEWRNGGNRPLLGGKTLAMVFQKPSLRTRVSFEVGMGHLGGASIMIAPTEIGFGKRESIADIARALSRYVQIIMARVFSHADLLELAHWSYVPVINGLSDEQHPCQAMADALTILERFGTLQGVKIAYVGDGNNVAASLAQVAAHTGAHLRIATPPGYGLSEEVMARVGELAETNGVTLESFHTPELAVEGAQVVYTDTWVSMGQEDQYERRVREFAGYQVNGDLVGKAAPDCIVMHCLPAHRGYEITDEVADGPHSALFDQAENRLHAQKAILATLLTADNVGTRA